MKKNQLLYIKHILEGRAADKLNGEEVVREGLFREVCLFNSSVKILVMPFKIKLGPGEN